MVWCSSCAENHDLLIDGGFLCCSGCGKVINQDNFSNEPTFVKNAAGQSQLAGNRVKTVQSDYSASHGRILKNAFDDMNNLARGLELGIEDNTDVLNPAEAFYKIALERNFTRGRRRELVEAACLYIACRKLNLAVSLDNVLEKIYDANSIDIFFSQQLLDGYFHMQGWRKD
ncbi:cyclin/Brf1-like TBP-binding protein [Actinidia rufa]|uniref:Cyclin/Brf1-like TBP-binding protein n=1 Tax=Actinidia rufa TaxID=165716 RepID=A0A7J0F4G0_9ERIC|nr:cyclin/Brf1-like TBP-binding protein [Actinidia rufa]